MGNKIVVLAEKPSVGRDIARVLKCNKKIGNGALEGSQYIVTWALGHLVELAPPEKYDESWKEWKMEVLPMLPKEWKLQVIAKTGKQFQMVKSQLMRKDVTSIVIATDAGREGELVARWILEKAGCKKDVKRLWVSSVTDKAIREGFLKLKNGKEYNNLYSAARSRAKADWAVGMNATRALTCKYNAQLSCGRVQTPTLQMIAIREGEIRNFSPESYYGCTLTAKGSDFLWQDKKSGSMRSFQKSKLENIVAEISGGQVVVKSVNKKNKTTQAPQLYDLTELQREANQKYDLSAKHTLNIMQRLYESHKVLTYPRTDSRYLTSDIIGTIKERLEACSVGPYRMLAQTAKKNSLKGELSFVNDAKVSDHHAIIPTEGYVELEKMTVEERKIYDLVIRRFFAVLYPSYEYAQTSVVLEAKGEQFVASKNVTKNLGWKAVYENNEEKRDGNSSLLELKEGEEIKIDDVKLTEGKTSAPSRFTEATLLTAMENPMKFMENGNKEDVKILGETGGLGTVATRADIIEKLFHSFLIEAKGKEISITVKGKQLLELVPVDLKKPELTASWEKKLSMIAKGKLDEREFNKEISEYAKLLTGEVKSAAGTFKHDNITRTKCPECGKYLLLVKGKNSTMKTCQDRTCGYKETISRTSNARCPKCHKKLELWGKGDGQQFVCNTCGHKEKLDSFTERRKKEGKGVSKKEVAKYLNKQNKVEEPINSAFADALKNLKL